MSHSTMTTVKAHPRRGGARRRPAAVRKHVRKGKTRAKAVSLEGSRSPKAKTPGGFFGLFREKTPSEKKSEMRVKERQAAEAERTERGKERLEDEAERIEERKLEKRLRREQLTEAIDKYEALDRLERESGRGKVGKLF